jgi:membrane-associated phospholipid phosphatase
MRRKITQLALFISTFLMAAVPSCQAQAQQSTDPSDEEKSIARETPKANAYPTGAPENTGRQNMLAISFLRNLASDQKAIWTSPAHLRFAHADWLVPLGGLTAGLLVTDRDVSKHLANSPSRLKHYKDFSNYGVAGMAGAASGLYLLGQISGDAHKKEVGLLSGEAALDAVAVSTILQYGLGRERPQSDAGRGRFWQGGNSFPSDHAAGAWAIASVFAHEYPGPLTKILVYGAATAISVARVRGKEHYPSDVLLGSGIGWLTGWQVYRAHHHPELGGGDWERLSGVSLPEFGRSPSAMGSPYLPLDSWIYPLFDRLIAEGFIDTAIVGMRPWTRLECARLVSEAGSHLEGNDDHSEASRLYQELSHEFVFETALMGGSDNLAAHLESVYSRFTEISGPPLTDGAHFGQTFFNDFGRPYQQGFNSVTGLSAWATAGRWVVHARGEYQHAPSGPGYSSAVQSVIAAIDANPVAPSIPIAARNQARLLDAYVGLNLGNWQLSYGQQSQWWGPGASGPMLFSDNASPVRMFHIDRVSPFHLPGIMKYLGPMRWDAYFGELQGLPFSPGPIFHGEKISFKPTRNLEFGFTRTIVFAGQGRALTLDRLFRSYFSLTSVTNETPATDPGKRSGGFDFQYRVPFLRKWLTLYSDSIAADDPSPLAAPRRAGFSPGIYVPQFPRLPKLDLRVEAASTNVDQPRLANGHFIYWDGYYHNAYTNRSNLMGSAVGRDGTEILAASRLWLGARNSLRFGYRHAQVDARYVPNGGTINDASIRADLWPHSNLGVTAMVQVERWKFPLLAPGVQQNVSGSLQFTYWPAAHAH